MASYEDVGESIGRSMRKQSSVQDNLSANDPEALLNVVTDERVVLSGSLTVTKKLYSENAFILDHPVQGDLGSSTLIIDGGYSEDFINYISGAFSYPADYEQGVEELYTITY